MNLETQCIIHTTCWMLPFATRGAAGGGGPTPTLCSHLSPHQGETLCGHTLPEGKERTQKKRRDVSEFYLNPYTPLLRLSVNA